MIMSLSDSVQRSQATNPQQSFIVQAPAGSGKTEILTQRYLRLLSTVSAPEQIVALTFTRKAACEMRERIILALQQANSDAPAKNAHQQVTLNFARQALDHSKLHQWDLLDQPNRLKVITIDSLCQSINQAIPLLEKHIAYPKITERATSHYLNAARRCIQFAIETTKYQKAIKILLLHADNRQDRLLGLFQALLGRREQWLTLLFQARGQEQATFEEALRYIEHHELNRFKNTIPADIATTLVSLSRELAIIENNPDSPRYLLQNWFDFKVCSQDIASALSQLILTGDKRYRSSFDHHVGLKKGVCSDAEYSRLKTKSKELLLKLQDFPDFLPALLQVIHLPNPNYNPEQWQVLQALFQLLPLMVGHLHVVFSEHNEVDFTTISQQALAALGDADNPTDLALYLDNNIHHLLVDEFQDTSITQFELLSKLVHGWEPGDGKTLFLVGDPMQSIYRFRQAEVGLFFRAKEQGIGSVQLNSLQLCCNFRSTRTIVNWVNQHFAQIFPQQVDIESGAVSFHPSVNVIDSAESSRVFAFQFKNREQEAQKLIHWVEHELNSDPHQSIAILVRSRSQLTSIISLLRQHHISYQGTDIDLLANLMHLRDVWSLTQALLSPGNRLSWLALLRSPYCGLSLGDIHCIARYNRKKSIYFALLHLDKISMLSEHGRIRAQFLFKIMQQALLQRSQKRLADWVAQTLKSLHCDNILKQEQLADLEQLWTLLDRYEEDGRLPDLNEFLGQLNKLYSQQANPSRLQIMTIHKSKGLEFDTVFLPGLGTQPNRGDSPMLRWLKIPTHENKNVLLVSPIRAAHQEHCALYDYLSRLDEEKANYEAQRLLYVAATRAKSRLYLMNSSSKVSKHSFYSLLKNQVFTDEIAKTGEQEKSSLPELMQLPIEFYLTPQSKSNFNLNEPIKELITGGPRLSGIVTHQLLQWICDHHPESIAHIPWHLARNEFRTLGFDKHEQDFALSKAQEQIELMYQSDIGLWIMKEHQNEQNEYELLVEHNHQLVTRIIDRMFEDKGKLWIVDFKTGVEQEQSQIKYRQQLNEYAYYLSSRTDLPIHCGIYYLPTGDWFTWQSNLDVVPGSIVTKKL